MIETLRDVVTWRYVTGAVVVYFVTIAFYRLFFHPLAAFPGPKLAAITRWYEGYYDLLKNGQYTFKIAEMHKKYGPIVRISPYELHIFDSSFYEKLYRHDGQWDKYAWSVDAFTAPGATIWTPNHHTHKARRLPLNAYFSKAKVVSQQDLIRRNVEKLCARISNFEGNAQLVDLGAATSAFTRDVAIEYILGKKHNSLDKEDFNALMTTVFQDSGSVWRITKHIRWFGPILLSLPTDWAIKAADEGTKAFLLYVKESAEYTKDRLAVISSSLSDETDQQTVLHAILRSDLPLGEKDFGRVVDDVATLSGAGFETPAGVLRLVFFHVFSNPKLLHRLRDEISLNIQDSIQEVDLKSLEKLPLLTAVLMEGLRLSPALATRSQRIAPDRDMAYRGYCIPVGTPVGMTTLLIHTNPELYPDPFRFDPDRWMDPQARKQAEKTWFPFSRGTRMCLGIHLAWAEMYMLLFALVQNFEFEFEDVEPADFRCISDQFVIGNRCRGVLKARVISTTV